MHTNKTTVWIAFCICITVTSVFGSAVAAGTEDIDEQSRLLTLLNKYPNDADLLIKLSKLKAKQGDLAGAINLLNKARNISPDYEDVYIVEAIMLARLNNKLACKQKGLLSDAYNKISERLNSDAFDRHLSSIDRGYFESELGTGYDRLSNNRGHWTSHYWNVKYKDCANNSYYAGLDKVKRYEVYDTDYHLGVAIPFDNISYALEYREANPAILLPKNMYFGQARYGFDIGVGFKFNYTYREYPKIESDTVGVGVDYYFYDYLVSYSHDRTQTKSNVYKFDPAVVETVVLSYYMAKNKYIGIRLSRGTELAYDNTENPPYSKIKTTIINGLHPISTNLGLTYELKRHHQSGYFEQNGVRLGVRYQFK